MRAAIEVISLAGAKKNINKQLLEDEIVVQAIIEVNEPKFLK